MRFYFGKNAPLIWHPFGSSNDCVAAIGAMHFSVCSLIWGYTLFCFERELSARARLADH